MGSKLENLPHFVVNGVSVPIVQELSNKLELVSKEAAKNTNTNIPNRYIRCEDERPGSQEENEEEEEEELPVIDMALLDHSPYHMQEFLEVCQDWGFFQVINHGIPPSLMQGMKDVSREFFGLPLNEKLKYADQGREGYGQKFVFSDQQSLDWSDRLHMLALPKHLRNLNAWPQTPTEFRCILDQYSTQLEKLGVRLLQYLGTNLGLDSATQIFDSFRLWYLNMRINYYPPCPNPDLTLGISPHSDPTVITMLLQDDDAKGLQIYREKQQKWQTVKPIPGALVINFGDLLEVMTNGRYRSIEHRAITNSNIARLSIVGFFAPGAPDDIIAPLSQLIDEEHPSAYRSFTKSEFFRHFFGARLQGRKILEDFISKKNT